MIWDNEPINSTELVRLCAQKLGWKKSTTYTVLKKLCDRGIL
ncbi:MAG: BlaI/MecI/CopY family transcriptional regulator, partial [Syntrophomonadaceae bacterium]|nr:BlaI/MecI/CopY family transcriptional regulator [Syntrophomonadaceae bacterium]